MTGTAVRNPSMTHVPTVRTNRDQGMDLLPDTCIVVHCSCFTFVHFFITLTGGGLLARPLTSTLVPPADLPLRSQHL